MARWILALASCSVIALGVAGCGDDDEATGFNSGVNRDTELKDLTEKERVTICQNQAAYVRARVDTTSLMRFVCAFTPQVFLAASDQACESAMTACVEALSIDIDVTVTDTDATEIVCRQVSVSQCQGSVADYEACVDSVANVQLNIGTDFSCGKRTQYADGPTVGVEACRKVGPACEPATRPVIR